MVRETTRWRFDDPALLWLFPVTYVIHLIEEWFATAPILLWHACLDRPLTAAFAAQNALALVLMIGGVQLVGRGRGFHWIVPAVATAVLLNTAGHLVGSIAFERYSAGLMTAMVFWIPLSLLTLVRVSEGVPATILVGGAAVGVCIEAIVLAAIATSGATYCLVSST
jgi:hypothetical protein